MIQYKNIHDKNIILMYKGSLTFDLLSSIIGSVEKRVNEFEKERKVQKKFYSILTECIQNVYYHQEEAEKQSDDLDQESVLILISAKKKYFSIKTCNNIPNSNVDTLKAKIDNINNITKDELKQLYREALANSQFSDKNTAGLGLMDIARKTDRKLHYEFEKINDDFSYFNMEIQLDRGTDDMPNKEESVSKLDTSSVQESLA